MKSVIFRRLTGLHKNPHTYLVILLLLYALLALVYTFQSSFIYRHNSFTINDSKVKLLSSIDGFDTYIIDRNSDIDVVYLHGSLISAKIHLQIAENLNNNIILPFYPGFCTSKGKSCEVKMKKCMHILADTLKKRKNRVRLFAQSMGTAVAYYLSTIIDCEIVVLENCFRNLKTVIKKQWYGLLYFVLNDQWSNTGIEDKKNIIFLYCQFDNIVGKDFSFVGTNKTITLKGASHFNAYKKVENYYEIVNNALENKVTE